MVNMLNTVTRKTNGLDDYFTQKWISASHNMTPKSFTGREDKRTTWKMHHNNLGGIILVGAQLLPGGGFNLVCGVGEAVWGLDQNCISWDPIASFSLGVSGNEVQGTRVSLWTIVLQKSLQVSNSIVMFGIALLPPHVALTVVVQSGTRVTKLRWKEYFDREKTFVKLWIRNQKSDNLFSTCIWYLLKFNRRTFENTKYFKWWLFKRLWSCEVCSCGSYLAAPPGNIQ